MKPTAYLDWISGARVLPEVAEAMKQTLDHSWGNASSRLHRWGVQAQHEVDRARSRVAKLIGAPDPLELIFTGSATEANNLAITGIARRSDATRTIVVSAIDHPSVRMPAEYLRNEGFQVIVIPVDATGRIRFDELRKAISLRPALVSIQHANTEIGTLQDLREIAALCAEYDVPLHSDGCGVTGMLPVNVLDLGVSAYTISAQNFYGPPGVGALWLKKGIDVEPLLIGGGQERLRRSGTENLPAIVGMGVAAEIATTEIGIRSERIRRTTESLRTRLRAAFANSRARSSYIETGDAVHRLPQNHSFRLDWVEGEALLLSLGSEGVAAVSGSACARPEMGASYVLKATGLNEEQCGGGITLSTGWSTTNEEIEYAVQIIVKHAVRLYEMSPAAILGE